MKLKKLSLKLLVAIVVIITMGFMGLFHNVKAADLSGKEVYFGIRNIRPSGMGYAIGNPRDNTTGGMGANIWDIIQYQSKGSDGIIDVNAYCIKAGVGFSNTSDKIEYNLAFDFKKEKQQILDLGNEMLTNLINGGHYNELLAILDLIYLPGVSSEDEKEALLTKAGCDYIGGDEVDFLITNDEIEAIQQAAIWYFTNYGEENNKYDKTDSEDVWFNYTKDELVYEPLRDYNKFTTREGEIRAYQAISLYNYLIETAKTNASAYENGTANSRTTVTLYTAGNNLANTQPVIIVEREPGEFDLALRKYITDVKLDGTNSTTISTRVPNIDETTLTGEQGKTTATYKHKKDPVEVKTGSLVTYNLTIYNEGEISGRATKVVDILPEGLEFVKVVSGNFEKESYTNNILTLKRKDGNNDNLKPYVQGKLEEYSETITIQCKVTAVADETNSKVLTNVAYISEAYDELNRVDDRDSEPTTVPDTNNLQDYKGTTTETDLSKSDTYYPGQQDDDDFEKLIVKEEPQEPEKPFDLKLIKRITAVNGKPVKERLVNVDISKLVSGEDTTAIYKMTKDPIAVKEGDLITYTFRVYNEGEIDGYAAEITEEIPEGLEFVWSDKTGEELENDNTFTEAEKEAILYNQLRWVKTTDLTRISTDHLAKNKGEDIVTPGANLIKAFDKNSQYSDSQTSKNPDYREVSVILKVVAENATKGIIRNEAAITSSTDALGNDVADRDSNNTMPGWEKQPNTENKYYDDTTNWPVYNQDDEDYDNIVLQEFDLALRKFITKINDKDITTRVPEISYDESKNQITYSHDKTPLLVQKDDIVIYTIRIFNEGDIAGYASEITDDIPEGLEFLPENELNKTMRWKMIDIQGNETDDVTKAEKIVTDYLSKEQGEEGAVAAVIDPETGLNINPNLIHSFNKNEEISEENPEYKDVQVAFKVIEANTSDRIIINSAQISEDTDAKGDPIDDKDSIPNEWNNGEDDQDQEFIKLQYFDLALRKFITKIEEQEITERIPQVKYDKENNKITYEHPKSPLNVVTGDIVTYTIRVYNEGDTSGYASEITDDIPEGLKFLPENELNKTMRWKMIDSEGNETDDIAKAEKITTDYLSKEQEQEENANLIEAFDKEAEISEENPDYKDVQVVFEVVEPNTSDKVIVNSAQISEDTDENGDPIDDIDSVPDEWNDGEDDQDQEFIELQYFDLALRKWVTQAIVIENGKETITQTGHTPEMDPEPLVKVELHRKKLNNVTVKFRYSIRVTNEGDIAGYVKEITDYIPEGLKFIEADNKGWKDEGNNVISTRLLENTLLQPGESADVEVLLTWVNSEDNMGQKINTAEISEDDNDKDVPDRDSTPDNKKPEEDDIDDAPVILSISTGQARIYYGLALTILITIAGGVILIKKFVL